VTDSPKLSIIIVNFETPEYTLDAVRSIYQHPPKQSYEIILIDNGSYDASLGRFREEVPDATCIEMGQNYGFARANNLGIANARGEYVLLLNSDTKILDDSLDRMLSYLEEHPDLGVLGPRQINGRGRLQLSWGVFPTLVSEIYRKIIHYRLSVDDVVIRDYLSEQYSQNKDVDWVSGSCLMARKQALLDAGCLDESFFMYFEDIDLCRQIRDAGWVIEYHSEMTVVHYGGISAQKNIMRVLIEYRRSQIYFTHKYYGSAGEVVLRMLLFFKYGSNFLRFYILFAIAKLFARETKKVFAELLLTKKTIELVVGRK